MRLYCTSNTERHALPRYCEGAFKWKIMKNAIPAIVCCMIKLIDGEFPVRRRERASPASSLVGRLPERFGMQINSNHFLEIYFTLIKPDWFSHSINLNYPRRHSPASGPGNALQLLLQYFSSHGQLFWADYRSLMIYSESRCFFRLRSGPRTARP